MPSDRRSKAPANDRPATPRGPEKKFGPYPCGIGVAVWLNVVAADEGAVRKYRSVTISPRRYQDRETGQGKDSTSFQAGDLPALIYALQRALDYVATTSIPGQGHEPANNANDLPY